MGLSMHVRPEFHRLREDFVDDGFVASWSNKRPRPESEPQTKTFRSSNSDPNTRIRINLMIPALHSVNG